MLKALIIRFFLCSVQCVYFRNNYGTVYVDSSGSIQQFLTKHRDNTKAPESFWKQKSYRICHNRTVFRETIYGVIHEASFAGNRTRVTHLRGFWDNSCRNFNKRHHKTPFKPSRWSPAWPRLQLKWKKGWSNSPRM